MKLLVKGLSGCLFAGLFASAAHAQEAEPNDTKVLEAVMQAVENNPEVLKQWHEMRAVSSDVARARGAYGPQLDASTSYNYTKRDYSLNEEFSGSRASLDYRQLLFDGFETSNLVERFQELQLVRYYELKTVAENVGYAAFEAYLDVATNRELVKLARDNVEKHRDVYEQIEESASAGVARNADLEQINGRLALALNNLETQRSNLHDVISRYLRIVGELPPKQTSNVVVSETFLPAGTEEAMSLANRTNPELHAALRNIRAERKQLTSNKRGAYSPKLSLVASRSYSELDDNGFDNRQNDTQVGLQLRFNILNGGRDYAEIRRTVSQVNSAEQQRNLVCRNINQTIQVEMNQIESLRDRIPQLRQHKLSSGKVRTAYKDQFDLGQRSLLDVLDSENEYFEASIALAEAETDLEQAKAKLLASMGLLLNSLNIDSSKLNSNKDFEVPDLQVNLDFACPVKRVTTAYYE
ncbi:TolC family outer membrane protein [uncultured Idiomarina sp.]|mgnify:CR=1 FL=1|uniref:TolC family outer membrane protein n=1 Tax=uncultured Idiomarina sp. TaxID=352961 RepID=UPI002595BBC1|nr:TolC family outer membrane protein [uncultured Idiomarina sp.]